MRSKKLRIILISLVATLFFLLKVTASQNVQAANLADGPYTVPVELLKQGTTEASMAKKMGYLIIKRQLLSSATGPMRYHFSVAMEEQNIYKNDSRRCSGFKSDCE